MTVPSCALDNEELRRQRARYGRLAPSVRDVKHRREALVVQFGPMLDDSLLEEVIAVERQCCPFFRFDYHERDRRLTVTVEDRTAQPALEALAAALRD
jgi:hypothetical protein